MNVKFEVLPEDSRIWVYQSNRRFSEEETSEISIELESFLKSWTSHTKPIRSAFQIKYNRFIFIAVDKDFETSGCSIDSSVSFIQSLEKIYKVDLLDKMNVAYKTRASCLSLGNDFPLYALHPSRSCTKTFFPI